MRLKKVKKTKKRYFVCVLLCMLITGGVGAIAAYTIASQIRLRYKNLLEEARQNIRNNQKEVYIATADIKAGSIISPENMDYRLEYTSQPEDNYITREDIGKTTLIDIPSQTHIQKSMLAPEIIASELRELEYNVININSNIINNDTVDIRIAYPNGESYVVLSKKVIKGLQPDIAICYLWLDEEELLRMSAAIVDAGLYPGSRLYVTKYIEPGIQEASIVNYVPSLSVLALIENNPNIIEAYSQKLNMEVRKALENRLAKSISVDITAVNWEINSAVTDADNYEGSDNISSTDTDTYEGLESMSLSDTDTYEEPESISLSDNKTNGADEFYYYSSNSGNDEETGYDE